MKLYMIPTSPYVRKARVVAIESGMADRVENIETPLQGDGLELHDANPIGKVPTLVLDDGTVLYDSPVICEYLDTLGEGGLIPASGPERWTALRRQGTADGILDCAVARRYESQRPEELKWEPFDTRQKTKIARALDALEAEAAAGTLGGAVTVGHIAIACALSYLDLRFAADDWRAGRPKLAAFYAAFRKRPSMVATEFPAV